MKTESPPTGDVRVFGVGTVVVDHVVVLPDFPRRDTKCAVQSHWTQVGGPVPVALSTAAFYGVPCSFAGRWGHDALGRQIECELSDRGIDLQPSTSDASWSTGFAHVWTEQRDGTRTIAFSRGAFPDDGGDRLSDSRMLLETSGILHLDGSSALSSRWAADVVKAHGGRVVLDAGSRKPGMETLLPLVDVLIASDLFCRSWFGRDDVDVHELHQLGANVVVRTSGAEGAEWFDGERHLRCAAADVVAVDTNGAGDVFSGAFLVGLARGWAAERTLKFANDVAGYCCARHGNWHWPEIA